jgi:NAD-dependent dihydropyrimidine dehydrogenase PreA subunit
LAIGHRLLPVLLAWQNVVAEAGSQAAGPYATISVEKFDAALENEAAGVPPERAEMAYVIAEPCIGTKDTACVDACPVDCIHPKKDEDGYADSDQLFIDPVECIDCGACVPVCPVSAIFAQDDLPEKWAHFTEKNAKHFGR